MFQGQDMFPLKINETPTPETAWVWDPVPREHGVGFCHNQGSQKINIYYCPITTFSNFWGCYLLSKESVWCKAVLGQQKAILILISQFRL